MSYNVLAVQKVSSGSGRAGRLRIMEKYIGHRLVVLAVSNVLTAQFFSNSRNFETEVDTPEKHGIKSLDP